MPLARNLDKHRVMAKRKEQFRRKHITKTMRAAMQLMEVRKFATERNLP